MFFLRTKKRDWGLSELNFDGPTQRYVFPNFKSGQSLALSEIIIFIDRLRCSENTYGHRSM